MTAFSFVSAPLKPLTAQNVGQTAGKEGHRPDQKEEIEHVNSLPQSMVVITRV
jgi:hypothetical protein